MQDLWLAITLLLIWFPAVATSQDEIRVRLNDFKPMSFVQADEIRGFDVDLLNAIGEELGARVTLSLAHTPQEALDDVRNGSAEIAAGGITITETRLREGARFTVPYFDSGLSILAVGSKSSGFFATARSLLTWGTLQAFGAMLAACFVFGIAFWYFERGSEGIKDDPRLGIPEGAYLAMASNTTIGFGDVTPKRWAGRFCVLLAWWIGAIPVGWMTARMAATEGYYLTNTNIEDEGDLQGKTVVAKAGTVAAETLRELGATVTTAEDTGAALEVLLGGGAEAFVHDTPGILHIANGEGAARTVVVGNQFNQQYYGFALLDDELRNRVNVALLALKRKGTYDLISTKWFGEP